MINDAVFKNSTIIIAFRNEEMLLGKYIYVPTHARAGSWLIGFALGYFLHHNKGRRIRMHPVRLLDMYNNKFNNVIYIC